MNQSDDIEELEGPFEQIAAVAAMIGYNGSPGTDKVEIEFNESGESKEALVRLKSKIPKKDFETKCRIRWTGPERTSYITAVLTNPDKRLGFSETELQLPPDGDWVDFSIYGEKKSVTLGDAKIEVHEDSQSGAKLGGAKVTVFYFEPADITVGKGSSFSISGGEYRPSGNSAVNFSASARIQPSGVDCSAKPLKNLSIRIVQNVTRFKRVFTYTDPVVFAWNSTLPAGSQVEVPTTMDVITEKEKRMNDIFREGNLIYDIHDDAKGHPAGCKDGQGKEAKSDDAPTTGTGYPFGKGPLDTFVDSSGGLLVYMYTKVLRFRYQLELQTWCVTYDDTGTSDVDITPLRETEWSLNVDSNLTQQFATVPQSDHAPTMAPKTDGTPANDEMRNTAEQLQRIPLPTTILSKP